MKEQNRETVGEGEEYNSTSDGTNEIIRLLELFMIEKVKRLGIRWQNWRTSDKVDNY